LKRKKGFTLTELLTVAAIVAVLGTAAIVGYRIYIKRAVISSLSNAVMVNVQLIDAYYQINHVWVTDAEPGNENLTEDDELMRFGLARRNLSDQFIMRVFRKEGFPHVIAREKIGSNRYGIEVSYHFKTRELKVEDVDK